MKSNHPLLGTTRRLLWPLALALVVDASSRSIGQTFNSGSNGSYGSLNVTADTLLDMPGDGVFHCTTITVSTGATVRFKRNPLNTPVYLLASGDVTIQGTIDVSGHQSTDRVAGAGGPGGFDGGTGPYGDLPPSEGQGPGGGQVNENGVFAIPAPPNNRVYGNSLLIPLIGGSGGGGYMPTAYNYGGGGGGGGAILVASSTKIALTGTVLARGGVGAGSYSSGAPFYGSGGAIRLVAPSVLGSGKLDTSSGSDSKNWGRIRIDSSDSAGYASLSGIYGKFASGSYFTVFPPGNPRLDIISAAGVLIPEGTNSTVSITLPSGSSADQLIRVQARNFATDVPIRVKITPELGPATSFDGVILHASGNPPFADVSVSLVPDTVCHIHAWTR